MIKGFFLCLFFAGIGVFAIWRGKQAIKNKFMANSRKSQFYTGVTHVEGEAAVRAGKVNIALGWCFIVLGLLGACGIAALGLASLFMDAPSSKQSSNQNSERARSTSDAGPVSSRDKSRNEFSGRRSARDRSSKRERSREETARSRSKARPLENSEEPSSEPTSPDDDSSDQFDLPDELTNGEANDLIDEFKEDLERNFGGQSTERNGSSDNRPFGSSTGRSGFGDRNASKKDASLPALDSPEISFPDASHDTVRAFRSDLIGFSLEDKTVEDDQKSGAILVGLEVGFDDFHEQVLNVQGIYQQGDQYMSGKMLGKRGGKRSRLIAPAGFAVSGVQVESGVRISAIRLAFMKLGPAGRLLAKTQVVSDWTGVVSGSSESTVDGKGDPVVAVMGGLNNRNLVSIGLIAVKRLEVAAVAVNDDDGDEDGKAGGIRTWKSDDGKYSVEARYVEHANGEVKLRKADGTLIMVEISRLGQAERDWIGEQE